MVITMKTALITGGARGIGLACAHRLAQDGFRIAIMDLCEAPDGLPQNTLFIRGNLASTEDRQKVVDKIIEEYGRIDVLINNAGVAPQQRADLLEMTEESYDRVMGINARGTLFLTQEVAKAMLKQEKQGPKRGTIINIGSCSAVVSSVNRGEYCVSKAAISMITTLFADRLAAEDIFVHELRPGVIETDMTAKVKEKYDNLIAQGAFPIKRWGKPEDVANAAAAFASDAFLYTTGNIVDIDGGFHIRRL